MLQSMGCKDWIWLSDWTTSMEKIIWALPTWYDFSFLKFSKLALWLSMWSILENIPWALEENVYSAAWDGRDEGWLERSMRESLEWWKCSVLPWMVVIHCTQLPKFSERNTFDLGILLYINGITQKHGKNSWEDDKRNNPGLDTNTYEF